jgi:Lon protease-like protein
MTSRALAGDRTLGMIAVRPEHVGEMPGDPPLFTVGCAGTIEEYETLPDGRYRFVLESARRFRVRNEIPRDESRLYRVAQVEWLDDPFPESDVRAVATLRREVIAQFRELLRRAGRERSEDVSESVLPGIDDARFINSLCQLLDLPTLEKQGLLEANGVRARIEQLSSLLAFRLAEPSWSADDAGARRH